ncbi:MAG: hypothetical protein V2J10_03675 [Wenzhouxiangella sp.]|jgi:hypothetical protein|nr:hypothetical protein [Wenzhouxiangella sp.]
MTHRPTPYFAALILLMTAAGPTAAQNQLDSQTWMNGMIETLPDFFCKDDQYFMQCFEVSEAECREVTRRLTEVCIEEVTDRIPALLDMPDDGRQWGTEVGRCAGIAYDMEMVESRSKTPACNPPG